MVLDARSLAAPLGTLVHDWNPKGEFISRDHADILLTSSEEEAWSRINAEF